MPIVHVYDTKESLVATRQELTSATTGWYLLRLGELGARIAIRGAGFSEDITPKSFANMRGVFSAATYRLDVDSSGEQATLNCSLPPGVTASTTVGEHDTLVVESGVNTAVVQEMGDALPLVQAHGLHPAYPMAACHVGGMIMRTDNIGLARLAVLFPGS